ncbi:DUF3501 family protein [Alicyclobacillaceae bacterium I2511]|nr:DUF3501 family protein [Alicyclobacillaceae bacterium I2511]
MGGESTVTQTHTLTHKDLVPLATYEKGRLDYLHKMIEYKNHRRVRLEPRLSVLFENKNTVLFQIQELLYSESLTDTEEIAEYIEIYSAMLPQANELSATLFVELDNQPLLEALLVQLKGIEHALSLEVGDETVAAVFEEEHEERDFTTSVHYIKFPLTDSARQYLESHSPQAARLRLVLNHPHLQAAVTLPTETVQSLKEDLQ